VSKATFVGVNMTILRSLKERRFDSEEVSRMGAAFDTTWQILKTSNPSLANGPLTVLTREAIAEHILDVAARGQTDVDTLIDEVVKRMRL
jgi:hypothetical protein